MPQPQTGGGAGEFQRMTEAVEEVMRQTQNRAMASLENQVRHGLEPENPDHITTYLRQGFIRAQGLQPVEQAREYKRMLTLLVEAIHDTTVSFVWRCHCLDFALEPAALMKSTAPGEKQKRAAIAIEEELISLGRCLAEYRQALPREGEPFVSGPPCPENLQRLAGALNRVSSDAG